VLPVVARAAEREVLVRAQELDSVMLALALGMEQPTVH
jgi:hypothetical protein